MKVLFDTNVVLDLLLDRDPHAEPAAQLFSLVESGQLVGVLGATTITTIHYLLSKHLDREKAAAAIRALLQLFEIASITQPLLIQALDLPFKDFEDAVLHEAGNHSGVALIITRNGKDFTAGRLPIHTPQTLLALLKTI